MKTLIKKLLKEGLGDKITYEVEHLDSYDGQSNYELGMYINGNIVGMVQYVLFQGKLTVSNIIVLPEMRRKGIASRMMQYLKQYHPDYTYKPSMQTQDGAAFKPKEIDDLDTIDEAYAQVDLINTITEKIYNAFVEQNVQGFLDLFNSNKQIKIADVFYLRDYIESNEYDGLFDENLKVVFTTSMPSDGIYIPDRNIIGLNTTIGHEEMVYQKNKMGRTDYTIDQVETIISRSYNYLKESLRHELRHAYENKVSGGKYSSDKKSKAFYEKSAQNNGKPINSKEDFNQYLRLPHEYWARFTAAVGDINFKGNRSFNEILENFKFNFSGWAVISNTVKQRLVKALYKYYDMKINGSQINEVVEGKEVSRRFLQQLLGQVNKPLAIKFLKGWIARGAGDMVKLSPKESNMLNLIKMGGPNPSDFHPRN